MSETLSELRRHKMSLHEVTECLKRLTVEPDRSLAIVGASLVEASLHEAIKSRLSKPEYFKPRTLSADSQRKLGQALGAVSENVCSEIGIVFDVRNTFAHSGLEINFNNKAISRECEKLKFVSSDALSIELKAFGFEFEWYETLDDSYSAALADSEGRIAFHARLEEFADARGQFMNSVRGVCFLLLGSSLSVKTGSQTTV